MKTIMSIGKSCLLFIGLLWAMVFLFALAIDVML